MQDVGIILTWWIVVQLLGLAAWPLARYLLRRLPDQGYTAAKPLGLLLVAFALWLLGSLHLVQNNLGGIWLALALVVAASVWALSYDGLASLHHWLSQNVKVVLVYELLFAVALCGWAAFRATTPAISSTEKPMEFALPACYVPFWSGCWQPCLSSCLVTWKERWNWLIRMASAQRAFGNGSTFKTFLDRQRPAVDWYRNAISGGGALHAWCTTIHCKAATRK
jgi:hypothetical protein